MITLDIGESELSIDAGLVARNETPEPQNDMAKTCADDEVTVDVLDNDTDPDEDTLTITAVDGKAIIEGQTIETGSGVFVTLSGGELVIDGEDAFAFLNIGDEQVDVISYTVSDGNGGDATADLAVTFCGDANDYASLGASLPDNASLTISGALDNPDAFSVLVTGTGDSRFDGETFTNAYCLSFFDPIPLGQPVLGDVFSTANNEADGVFDSDQTSNVPGAGPNAVANLDLIQYIVAQDYENNPLDDPNNPGTPLAIDGWDIQFAIWELTDPIDTDNRTATFTEATPEIVDAIIADALANGEGFSFEGDGEIAGLVFDPNPQTPGVIEQPFIVAFDFDDYDCIC